MHRAGLTLILTGFLTALALPAPVAAETDDATAADVPASAAFEIGRQLTACLRPLYPDSPAHEDVVLSVDLDEDGIPGAATLIRPAREDATDAHMRQLFRAEAAVIDCTPIFVDGAETTETTLTLVATAERLEVWDPGARADDSPRLPALAADEEDLALGRRDRREIQARLKLAGHDPGPIDGAFGPRTRAAIVTWQAAEDWPETGYVDAAQIADLRDKTKEEFAAWRATQSSEAKRPRTYVGRDGCLRYRNGRIVQNRSLECDFRAMLQKF